MRNDTEKVKYFETVQGRFMLVLGIVVLLISLVAISLVFFLGGNDNNEEQVVIQLSQDEKTIIENDVVKEFLNVAGNFGLITETTTKENIRIVQRAVMGDTSLLPDYWITRQEKYLKVRKDLVYSGSELDYSLEETTKWKDEFSKGLLLSNKVSGMRVKVPDNANKTTLNNVIVDMIVVRVDVLFEVKWIAQSANDVSWDGSYDVFTKNFSENFDIIIVRDGNSGWKVGNVQNLGKQFLLSTWRNPNESFLADIQGNVTKDKLK